LLLLVGLPQLFRKRYKRFRRNLLRNFGVFLGALVLAVVMVNVNACVAPLRAQRLINAIESYRAATGTYPQTLDYLVPKYIDHVPCAAYTLRGRFSYVSPAPTEALLWYSPHGMDNRTYILKDKRWRYSD
jgi:hypothetical protein